MGEVSSYIFNMMDYADQRIRNFPMMNSPHPVLWIVMIYLLCVFFGPKLMEGRQPFQLKALLLIYNPFMCLYNFVIVYVTLWKYLTRKNGSFVCVEIDQGESQDVMEILYLVWFTLCLKIIELTDTIFFILRKKNSQITFLHIYHHATVVLSTWLSGVMVPGGQVWFVVCLNSCVHVFMYGYYTLASMGPHMQKYLWWKRYLTMLQLIQFILLMVHCTLNLFAECNFPKLYNKLFIPYFLSHFLLFMHFYFTKYKPGQIDKKKD